MKSFIWVVNILVGILGTPAFANVLTDEPVPIGHCYHWLQTAPGYLDFKYSYAKDNGNELTFYTSPATSNGSVAGPGLYCAKSPSGSYGYGDRIIRIEFVSDVVILDEQTGRKYCGENGRFYANDAECQSKDADVKLYNRSPDWYVIQNPRAVKSWSATIPEVINDLNAETSYADGGFSSHAQTTINAIQNDISKNGERNFVNARARMGFSEIVKSEKLLRSLPALTILSEFNRPENKKIDKQLMAKVLESTVTRVLQDDYLPWADVKPVIKSNPKIKQAFVVGIQKQLANFSAKSEGQKNFDVMLIFAGQKDSGITVEQIQFLISETFKNPSNFGQTRFAKGDLSEDLKKGLVAELSRRLQAPGTKNDISLLASLVTFTSINDIDAQIRTDVTALFYEHLKSLTASKFFLADRKTKYPLGDTTQIATQLCQANIAAYNLVNKELFIISGDLRIGVGQLSNISNAASFCQQQTSLMDVLATIPRNGDSKIQVIKGTIENLPFKFVAIDQESAQAQVKSFLKKNNIMSIHNLNISVDKSEPFEWSSSYGSVDGEDNIVNEFTNAIVTQGVFARDQLAGLSAIAAKAKGKSHKLKLVFDDLPFTFNVDFIEDFDEQCLLLAPTLDKKEVSTVYYSWKDSEQQDVNTETKTAKDTCHSIRGPLMTAGMKSKFEKKALADIALLGKGKKNKLKVSYDEFELNFTINNIEDFDEQCKLFSYRFENYTIRSFSWSLNDDFEYGTLDDDEWSTTAESCGALRAELLDHNIPSKRVKAVLSQIASMGRGKTNHLKVNFDAFETEFKVNSVEDFEAQCALIGPALEGRRVDSIYFELNGRGRKATTHPTGHWKTVKETCEAIRSPLAEAGLASKKQAALLAGIRQNAAGKKFQIRASFENTLVNFGANNMEELTAQCSLLGDMFDGRETETMSYKIGKNEAVDFSSYGTLGTTKEVCEALQTALRAEVLPKALADVAAVANQSRHSFVAVVSNLPIVFAVNSKKELNKQCMMLLQAANITVTGIITLYQDKSLGKHVQAADSADAICKIIEEYSYGFIPSQEQQEILQLNRKVTVQAYFDGTPMTFKVDNSDQLIGQCLNLTDEQGVGYFDTMTLKVGKNEARSIDQQMNSSEACKIIAKAVF